MRLRSRLSKRKRELGASVAFWLKPSGSKFTSRRMAIPSPGQRTAEMDDAAAVHSLGLPDKMPRDSFVCPLLLRTNCLSDGRLYHPGKLRGLLGQDSYKEYIRGWSHAMSHPEMKRWAAQSPRAHAHVGIVFVWSRSCQEALLEATGGNFHNPYQLCSVRMSHAMHVFASFKFDQPVGIDRLVGPPLKPGIMVNVDVNGRGEWRKAQVVSVCSPNIFVRVEREGWARDRKALRKTWQHQHLEVEETSWRAMRAAHQEERRFRAPTLISLNQVQQPLDYNTMRGLCQYVPEDCAKFLSLPGVARLRSDLHPASFGLEKAQVFRGERSKTARGLLEILSSCGVRCRPTAQRKLSCLRVDSMLDLLLVGL